MTGGDVLTYAETRGYWLDDATGRVSSGWFALDHRGRDGETRVIRRRVGGRNRYYFADVSSGRFVADPVARPGACRFGFAS